MHAEHGRLIAAGVYAAIDLGSNNCRLLVVQAQAQGRGYRTLEAWSRIVRLAEGVARTGRLSEAAMERALEALAICARRLSAWPQAQVRAIATAACRGAENGRDFLELVRARTGLVFDLIDAEEEAMLAVRACADLIEPGAPAALVVDIGGGSTELSWVRPGGRPSLEEWASLPLGVVHLAETRACDDPEGYAALVDELAQRVGNIEGLASSRPAFASGAAHIVGSSGAVTALAGEHLGLRRYARDRVDGLWLTREEAFAAARRLSALGHTGRARHPCIGPQRADLVLPGAAILEAVLRHWPSKRIRVADRGLREGVILSMMERTR